MKQNSNEPSRGKLTVLKEVLRRHNKEIVDLKKSVLELESFKDILIKLLNDTDYKSKE